MNVWVHTCAVIDVGASQIVIYRNGERAISQSHVGRVADIAREFNFLGKSEDRTAFVGRLQDLRVYDGIALTDEQVGRVVAGGDALVTSTTTTTVTTTTTGTFTTHTAFEDVHRELRSLDNRMDQAMQMIAAM